MKYTFMKNNYVFTINSIKYVSFKSVYCYTIINCYIKTLNHRYLTMLSVLVVKN